MSRSPEGRRPSDPLTAAEAAFEKVTTKPAEASSRAPPASEVKDTVTLRIDQDAPEHFQQNGPGWQDRIDAALQGGWQVRDGPVHRATPVLGHTIMTALLLVDAAAGALAQGDKPVHYTCADGTNLRAVFSPRAPGGIRDARLCWISD